MTKYSLSELFEEKKEIKELFVEFMKEQFAIFIETLSAEERDAYCEKNRDSKNGFYKRKFDTMFGRIEDVKIPRTRSGEFYPSFLEKYQRRTFELEEIVISMYQGGCSTRDIARTLTSLLEDDYTPWMISRITDKVTKLLDEYHSRKFDKWYPVLYIDGVFVKLRREIVFKEVVYTVMGINEEGHKEIIDFRLMGGSGESSINWKEMLADLKERGLKDPLVVVGDGLPGLREAVFEVYPEADFQHCILHKVKSSLAKVKKRDEMAVSEDLKEIYFQQDKKGFEEKFEVFKQNGRSVIRS
jgi:putative transposase